MAKVTLNDITSGHGSADLHNANYSAIEAALEVTLSRDGTSPNQMQADLDMNGFSILNIGSIADPLEWRWRGTWTTATAYVAGDVVYVELADSATRGGRTYRANTDHTSGTFDTDFTSGYWNLVAERGATGPSGAGTGDLLASNNLSDLANLTTALNNLITAHGPLATADIADDAITLDKLASGTDGELITWDASGDPATVAVGTAGHVLTSNGAGAAPTFQASTSTAASQAQMEAASSNSVFVTPGRQKFHPGMAKAWALSTNSSGGVTSGYNVATIAQDGSGHYDVTFSVAMSSTNYVVVGIPEASGSGDTWLKVVSRSTGSVKVGIWDENAGAFANGRFQLVAYGDQ